jgi:hypothetical protein
MKDLSPLHIKEVQSFRELTMKVQIPRRGSDRVLVACLISTTDTFKYVLCETDIDLLLLETRFLNPEDAGVRIIRWYTGKFSENN